MNSKKQNVFLVSLVLFFTMSFLFQNCTMKSDSKEAARAPVTSYDSK